MSLAGSWDLKELPTSSVYKGLIFGLTHLWPMLNDPKRPRVPDSLKDRERFVIALEEYFKSVKYRSLIHGDAHTGNTFTLSDGSIGFLDWQLYDIGSPFQDLAYLVVGSLSIEDRRAHEVEILDEYLEKLAEHGGPRLARDQVLAEYQVSSIVGFPWSLTPSEMQSMERLVTMTERYCASILDHDVIEKLVSLRTNSAY
jgi:aminoglycoside phosphotransferase (APT) family kinase protein